MLLGRLTRSNLLSKRDDSKFQNALSLMPILLALQGILVRPSHLSKNLKIRNALGTPMVQINEPFSIVQPFANDEGPRIASDA